MRRALKTSSALAKGLSYAGVIVDPTCFEEGGCYHDHVDMSDMKGLARLEAMSDPELEQLKQATGQRTTFPGLTAADVLDPSTLSAHLNVTPETASFVKEVLPGMESGWYAAFDRCETRRECFARAKHFVDKVKAIAMADNADTVVLVSHGDLMDAMLKNLIGQADVEDRVLDNAIRFAHTNTGITRVEIGKNDGMAHVMVMNESTHLEATEHTGGEMLDGWGKWRQHAW